MLGSAAANETFPFTTIFLPPFPLSSLLHLLWYHHLNPITALSGENNWIRVHVCCYSSSIFFFTKSVETVARWPSWSSVIPRKEADKPPRNSMTSIHEMFCLAHCMSFSIQNKYRKKHRPQWHAWTGLLTELFLSTHVTCKCWRAIT